MNYLGKLAGQTAIYGLSSILGRAVNYFILTPLYTRVLSTEQYGIITDIYAYVAFLIILFTYGMETGFFRFSETEENKKNVYGTALVSLLISGIIFITTMILCSETIATWLKYPDHEEYIILFAILVGADSLIAIPFARLRQLNKAMYFALIKLSGMLVNIGLNVFFFIICPWVMKSGEATFAYTFIQSFYNPDVQVWYVFVSNLASSLVTFIILIPFVFELKIRFDFSLWKKMMVYCLPLLVAGLAGITNQHIDKILLKYLLPHDDLSVSLGQLGIYGACYKLSIIIMLIIQAFSFAADPFFFANAKQANAKEIYSEVMKYYVIVISFIFLCIMMYFDFIKYFIGVKFHEGLGIVPVLLIANIFFGIYYNLAIWYKLSGKTQYGAYLSIGGAMVTIIMNILLIPVIGYWGSAWATVACYGLMMITSYFWGQKYFPIDYKLKNAGGYLSLAILLYLSNTYLVKTLNIENALHTMLFNTIFVVIYVSAFVYIEIINKEKQSLSA